MNFFILIVVFTCTFQHISCMNTLTLVPRPKDSNKFLQSLAQLHHEFEHPIKQSKITLTQQKRLFEMEIEQQQRDLRENNEQLKKLREQLEDIITQQKQSYNTIKEKNRNLIQQIHKESPRIKPQREAELLNIVGNKLQTRDYQLCGNEDIAESLELLYTKHKIKSGHKDRLKDKLHENCIKQRIEQESSTLTNGFIAHYNIYSKNIEMILVDLSTPHSNSSVEKKMAMYQKMKNILLSIEDISQHITLIESQIKERTKQVDLLLKEQELLQQRSSDLQTIQNRIEKELDEAIYKKLGSVEFLKNH